MGTGILLLFLQMTAFADDGQPVFHLHAGNPEYPIEKLKKPGIKIHKYLEANPGSYHLPTLDERDRTFRVAGLKNEISEWDELDKDKLYLTARDSNLNDLKKKYNQIEEIKLKKLASTIKSQARKLDE